MITRSLTTDRSIGWTRSWVIPKLSTTPLFMSSLTLVRYCSQHCSPGIFLVKFSHFIWYSLQFASIDLSIVLLYYEIMCLTKNILKSTRLLPGTYVFKDMGVEGSQMIVRVMPATSSCESYPYQVLPTSVDSLTKLGVNKTDVSLIGLGRGYFEILWLFLWERRFGGSICYFFKDCLDIMLLFYCLQYLISNVVPLSKGV